MHWLQGDVKDLRSRNAALEERAEEAEGALAAAQAEVEVVTRDRQRSVAALTAQAEQRQTVMVASHTCEARILPAAAAAALHAVEHDAVQPFAIVCWRRGILPELCILDALCWSLSRHCSSLEWDLCRHSHRAQLGARCVQDDEG